MKIVVLDGKILNPGDLSWGALETMGQVDVYDHTEYQDTVARCKDAEVILINKVVIDKPILEALPKLRYIGATATGYDTVDVKAATARGVTVTNVPTYGSHSVAQATFALLLELTNQTGHHNKMVHEGKGAWGAKKGNYWESPAIELADLKMGIIGFGHIGQEVAKRARAFGMDILVNTWPAPKPEHLAAVAGTLCSLDEVLAQADVISLHCPALKETEKLINAERLAKMKPTAFLLNASRGALIDEPALADALNKGQIAGAGLDVLLTEPPAADNPLLTAQNCIITPHLAWATFAARKRLLDSSIDNVRAFIGNSAVNVINAPELLKAS
jgi:glycerate dehydrogenase